MISTNIELFLLRPVFILLFILILPYYLAAYLDSYLHLPNFFIYPSNLIGLAIATLGIFLDVYTVREFLNAKGTPMPWKPPKGLITTGPFKYTRNPIYFSWTVMIAGVAIFTNLLALFIIIPIFMAAVHFGVVVWEERKLEKTYGKRYIEYKKKVPRWIPKIW